MPKIKIAFIIDTIESPTAGTEKQLLLLLKGLDRNHFKPCLCCLQSSKWLKKFKLCPVYLIDIKYFINIRSYARLWEFSRFLKKNKFDIVQTHFRDGNIIGVIAAKMAGIKTVISSRRNQGYWHNRIELFILKILNHWTTYFIANSLDTKQFTQRVENIANNKIRVIYNGLDIELFKYQYNKKSEIYRKKLNISDESPVVGIIANLRPVKGLDVFLKSAHLVATKVPKVKILIVGDGVEKEKLSKEVQRLHLGHKVHFLGKVKDIVPLLRNMDIGVLSSYSESFSNAILEYMIAGLPVVCTNIGGNREAIIQGENGFVVPIGDHKSMADNIIKILNNEDLAKEIGRKNIIRAESMFSSHVLINSYENFYREIVYEK